MTPIWATQHTFWPLSVWLDTSVKPVTSGLEYSLVIKFESFRASFSMSRQKSCRVILSL